MFFDGRERPTRPYWRKVDSPLMLISGYASFRGYQCGTHLTPKGPNDYIMELWSVITPKLQKKLKNYYVEQVVGELTLIYKFTNLMWVFRLFSLYLQTKTRWVFFFIANLHAWVRAMRLWYFHEVGSCFHIFHYFYKVSLELSLSLIV